LLGIVLVLDRARTAALAESLDRAPIDDEPLADEDLASTSSGYADRGPAPSCHLEAL